MAISFTYGLFLVSLGLGSATYAKMEESAVQTAGGNLLIHADGFWASQGSDFIVRDAGPVIEHAQTAQGVDRVVPRVLINGLLSSPRGNSVVMLRGIDPALEGDLIKASDYLSEGTFLGGDDANPLVLGQQIVEELEVELGDRIVLTATDPDGEMVRALFELSGIVESGSDSLDQTVAFTSIAKAQESLGVGESDYTQIGLVLDDDSARFAARDEVEAALGPLADGLELLTWDEAIPDLKGYIEMDANFNYLFSLIIFVVVGFGIANTFLMIVMERIRELGLLGALGMRPGRIARLLLTETFLVATISLIIGFAFGFSLHLYLSKV
ncbi:MAG: ABC transporter permease, partial [Myxococcales bacterium]|nr:ABC transporter permease [Myxococcales bacterium]